MKLSVLIPVYNEVETLNDLIGRVQAVPVDKELIMVDDCSTDGTRDLLKRTFGEGKGNVKVFYHEKNGGKGSAIRTALSHATGDYCIIQDADLEYNPEEYTLLLGYIAKNNVPVVYGSRFLKTWRSTTLPHYLVNAFFTGMTNVLFGCRLTDMETCYKMVRTDIFKSLDLKADKFELEPEITVKLLRKGCKISEVPISYRGRSYHEGKKIGWKDAIHTFWVLIKYRFS